MSTTEYRRRPLKIHPEPEVMLEELVRAMERIADGLQSVVETIDALVTEDERGRKCLRMDRP
jgi:hypothetical protein